LTLLRSGTYIGVDFSEQRVIYLPTCYNYLLFYLINIVKKFCSRKKENKALEWI